MFTLKLVAKLSRCLNILILAAFVVGSPKGDLGHLGDLLPKRGLLKVTFLFKSLLSERKDDGDVLHTSGNDLFKKILMI